MAGLALKNVNKTFGPVEVIRDFNLDIDHGEFIVFVGPSGCGKSTLLRMIAGLETISSGDLFIGGRRCNDVAPRDRGAAMVFQSYALYPHMSVAGNIGFGLKLAGTPKAAIDEKVKNVARILQLQDYLDRKPAQLSGGQRQRVAIGRAIIREPEVFLFDEPLSNLDAALRVGMRMELAKLHGELGATMIYVTHDQVEAMTLADRIVVLEGGRVQQIGTPLELYNDPANLFVAGFIGAPKMNFFDMEVTASDGVGLELRSDDTGTLDLPSGARHLSPGARVTMGLRPHFLRPAKGESALGGTILLIERLGDATIVEVALPSGKRILASIDAEADIRVGDPLALDFDRKRALVFDGEGQRVVLG